MTTNDEIRVRLAEECDLNLLRALSAETFRETFAESNTEEDMARYITEHFSAERLGSELRTPESRFYLAQTAEGEVVGYLKLNTGTAQTEPEAPEALEIERIYVLRAFLGAGVGQRLFEEACHQAEAGRHPYLWLGVWEHNPRAIRFYEKNGFSVYGEHTFVLGGDPQRDLLMKRPTPL